MGLAAESPPLTAAPFLLQERKLQLVFESLMQEPWGSSVLSREQCSILSALAGRRLGAALAPGRR